MSSIEAPSCQIVVVVRFSSAELPTVKTNLRSHETEKKGIAEHDVGKFVLESKSRSGSHNSANVRARLSWRTEKGAQEALQYERTDMRQ